LAWTNSLAQPRRNKYNVAAKEDRTHGGIVFASKHEMMDFCELRMLEQAGVISDLKLQPRFKLPADITYVADFQYVRDGLTIVQDSKGVRTPVYKMKLRLFKSTYPHLVHLET
jgi:hypothetical protein